LGSQSSFGKNDGGKGGTKRSNESKARGGGSPEPSSASKFIATVSKVRGTGFEHRFETESGKVPATGGDVKGRLKGEKTKNG